MKILWLASWYPNPYEPYNGDFIQRHARAVAMYIPVDVIHVLQHGGPSKNEATANKTGDLTEYFYAFDFKSWGISWIDKIRYTLHYHRFYKKLLDAYIESNGKPDLVHVHVPVKAGLMALYLLKKYKIPYIVSEQSSHYELASPNYFFKRNRYYRRSCRSIFSHAVAVTNVSETIGKVLKQLFKIKHYETIHNLVDTTIFSYLPHTRAGQVRLIHVSALGEQKNPEGMIRALAHLKTMNQNWSCMVCGPFSEKLSDLVKENNLQNDIHFTGEIPYSKVAAFMQQADVFILFSNHENFPCVVVEALCCGLPVVSSVAGGIAEAINNSNGILVQAGDEKALAAAINKTIQNIAGYSPVEIAAGAAKLYNQHVIANSFVQLYKNCLATTNKPL